MQKLTASLPHFVRQNRLSLSGEAGSGKTSLLRYLAYYAFDTRYPDGIVHLSLRRQSASDVLQSLFEAFYELGNPFNLKPTDVQIRFAVQDKQALILFDDVDLAREELEAIMDAAPGCTFVITSAERQLWAEGSTLSLAGLPLDDAMTLFERELGRPLTDDERPEAKLLCLALEGHPLRLIQAAAIFRGERRSVALMMSPETSTPAQALAGHLITSLSEPERQILMSLTALSDASVRTEHLAGMTGLSNSEPILDSLAQRAVIRAENGGYRLDAALTQELQQQPDAAIGSGRPWRILWIGPKSIVTASIVSRRKATCSTVCWTALLRRSVGARRCAWSCRSKVRWRWAGAGARGIASCALDLMRRGPCVIGLPRPGRSTRSARARSAWNKWQPPAAVSSWRSVCASRSTTLRVRQ